MQLADEIVNQESQLLSFGEGIIGEDHHKSLGILRGDQKPTDSQDLPTFPLSLILEATQYFSEENKLGEGGFGTVYKVIPLSKLFENIVTYPEYYKLINILWYDLFEMI